MLTILENAVSLGRLTPGKGLAINAACTRVEYRIFTGPGVTLYGDTILSTQTL